MGTGTLHNKVFKTETTESEVVGVSEYLPYDIWQVNFFKEQDYQYDIRNNYIYQDNERTLVQVPHDILIREVIMGYKHINDLLLDPAFLRST